MCNKVLCRICNKEIGILGFTSHLKMHNIKFKDYVQDNIDDFPHYKKIPCPVCGKLMLPKHSSCSKKYNK